jgi:hypothetical protein
MRIAHKLFLIAVLSVTFIRGASAYEPPTLPMPSPVTGVAFTLPAGIAQGTPGTGSLQTALLGGGSFSISLGDDDDDDYGLDDDDDDDDDDGDDVDDDDDDDDDGLDICVGDLCDDDD